MDNQTQNNDIQTTNGVDTPVTPIETTQSNVTNVTEPATPIQKKKGHGGLIATLCLIIVVAIAGVVGSKVLNKTKEEPTKKETKKEIPASPYQINGYGLGAFDLYFLQLENNKKNKVYSPLSIKYTLAMLNEGTDGDSNEQIKSIIGDYSAKKYTNNKNMSFANALFVKNDFKDGINKEYVETLKNKYDADVGYDSFASPKVVNDWINNKTFKLINNMYEDVSAYDYILVNALAIDMYWNNQLQYSSNDKVPSKELSVKYPHTDYSRYIDILDYADYTKLKFGDLNYNVKAVEVGTVAQKYDIINTLGEDNIKKTVTTEYNKWLANGAEESCADYEAGEKDPTAEEFFKEYIKELGSSYKDIQISTDFMFYINDNVKVFAKDLQKSGDTQLQYVGIMPTKVSLDSYIKDVKAADITTLINNLKSADDLTAYKDGVVTELTAYIPLYDMDYELNLLDDLKKLGVTDIFDANKANLIKMTSAKNAHISDASHKAKIEFSNDGIKAAAVTSVGGKGSGFCGFEYIYKLPVEKVNLTFDKPFLFLIRDKDSGEVWFTGTVYEPSKWVSVHK